MVHLTGENIVTPDVREYLFIDLDGDDRLELVAAIDVSDHASYATAIVVNQNGHRLDYQFLGSDGLNIPSLLDSIEDLDGDGDLKIVISRLLAPPQGEEPVATFTDVCSLDGYQYAVSHPLEYEDFYRNRILPQVERNIDAFTRDVPNTSGPEERAKQRRKYEIEKDELLRILQ